MNQIDAFIVSLRFWNRQVFDNIDKRKQSRLAYLKGIQMV